MEIAIITDFDALCRGPSKTMKVSWVKRGNRNTRGESILRSATSNWILEAELGSDPRTSFLTKHISNTCTPSAAHI